MTRSGHDRRHGGDRVELVDERSRRRVAQVERTTRGGADGEPGVFPDSSQVLESLFLAPIGGD